MFELDGPGVGSLYRQVMAVVQVAGPVGQAPIFRIPRFTETDECSSIINQASDRPAPVGQTLFERSPAAAPFWAKAGVIRMLERLLEAFAF